MRIGRGAIVVAATMAVSCSCALAVANAQAAGRHKSARIAFVRGLLFPEDAYLYDAHIYTVVADGSGLRQVTGVGAGSADSNEMAPSWSPSGRKLLFVRYGITAHPSYSLWAMNADGSHQRRLADDLAGAAPCAQDNMFAGCAEAVAGAWSPDGRQIAFARWTGASSTGHFHIWLMAATGAHLHQLTHGADELHPSWSPDGKNLTFFRTRTLYAAGGIWLLNVRTRVARRLAPVAAARCDGCPPSASSWAPSGRWIAFASGGLVTRVSTAGNQQRELTRGLEPAWAPAGNGLAFASPGDSDGQYRISTISGGAVNEVTHALYPVDDEYPAWQPLP